MDATVTLDPVLRQFREAWAALYGPAGGEAGEHSDYDVAVFLRDVGPGVTAWYRLADFRTRILDAGGPFFEAIPFRSSDYERHTEIRRDGVIL